VPLTYLCEYEGKEGCEKHWVMRRKADQRINSPYASEGIGLVRENVRRVKKGWT
jgi:hypothetical protein